MLNITLPNKGSLSQEAIQLVNEAGYICRRYSRELVVRGSFLPASSKAMPDKHCIDTQCRFSSHKAQPPALSSTWMV